MMQPRPDTRQKALEVNLDAATYGTLAEIGAGQEVARWFFRAGRAANTVAKTISAYDMAVSDALYGRSDHYVSRKRLESMLAHEFDLLVQHLGERRGNSSTFFVFADTVATRSHERNGGGHGWMGIRFQTQPREEPSEVIIHVSMLDKERVHEQEALGTIGINLIHGAFYLHQEPTVLIGSLLDNLSHERVGVDLIKFSGPTFASVDNRLMSLQLVEQGLSDAVIFTGDGEVVQPSEILYKKPVLVERGSFRPITNLTLDLLERAQEQFLQEPQLQGEQPVILMEMTLRDLTVDSAIPHADFLARVDILRALGKTVLISNYGRYFHLVEYLQRYTQQMIGIALGVPSLAEIANENHYADLHGGILESLGRFFKRNVKAYVYPYSVPASGQVITAETLPVAPQVRPLLAYLLENHYLESIHNYTPHYLHIASQNVLDKIRSGDATWESLVPVAAVRAIKQEQLFGWRPPLQL